MLRITVELVDARGRIRKAVARGTIENDGTSVSPQVGQYLVKLASSEWKERGASVEAEEFTVTVFGHTRLTKGPWHLIAAALKKALG